MQIDCFAMHEASAVRKYLSPSAFLLADRKAVLFCVLVNDKSGVMRSCAFGDTGTSKVKVRVSKTADRAVKAKAALCAAVYSAVVEKGYTGIRCCNSIGYQRAVARTDLMAAHEHRFSSRLRVGTVALAMKPNK